MHQDSPQSAPLSRPHCVIFVVLIALPDSAGSAEICRVAAVGIIDSLMKWSINKPSFTVSRGEFESGFTMSSYQIVSHFPAIAKASGNERWRRVIDTSYAMFDHFLNLNPRTALTPLTFMVKDYGVSQRGYLYGYDSSRVPWRVGLDYLWNGENHSPVARILPDLNAKWLLETTGGGPSAPYVRYQLDGAPNTDNGKDPRVTVPPIAVGAMVGVSNQEWLDTLSAWRSPARPWMALARAFSEIPSCSVACWSSPATCPVS